MNAVSGRKLVVGELFEKMRKVGFGTTCGDAELTPTGARFHGQEQVRHAVSRVFVVNPLRRAGSHQLRLTSVAEQLAGAFIDAH